jgi:hypothetical protein
MPSDPKFSFADEPAPEIKQPQQISPAQQLLNWTQRWPHPSFSIRDVRNFGPNSSHHTMKDPKNAREAIETLVRHRWLIPTKPLRGNAPRWEIVRKPIAHPVVDS